MNNLKDLTSANMNEDGTKPTDLQKPAGNLHIISEISLTDKDIDQVLAEYSDTLKNLVKSESKDLLLTIFDSLDKEQHVVTSEVVNRSYHDSDNILTNGTMINELPFDVENISQNTTQNVKLMEDNRNEGIPNFEKDKDEKISNSFDNNKEISEFIEISVPAYDMGNNDPTLKKDIDTTNNPFGDLDVETDIYAFGFDIAQFKNDSEYIDNNDYSQIQDPTDAENDTEMINNIDYEEYIPVYANLLAAQTINEAEDTSINLRSQTTTHKNLRCFRKEANLQTSNEINVVDHSVVSQQKHFGDDNCINIKPIKQVASSQNQVDVITLPGSSDSSSSDVDNIPISRLRNYCKSTKPFFGITNKIETISIDSEESDMDDDPCNGYHSSDFEFISETEAEMDGFITANKDTQRNEKHPKKVQTPKLEIAGSRTNIGKIQNNRVFFEYPNLPGPSNASQNYYSPKRNKELRNTENHRVPEGDDYFALFQGIYDPNIISPMENKSIYYGTKAGMQIEFGGIDFEMMQIINERNRKLNIGEEYKEEANKTAKRIMKMYPDANKKHRRRRF